MVSNKIAHARLASQGIANPDFEQPGDVVAWLGALQAQDYTGSLWTIGLRMATATESLIEQAVADRTIVRTWPMRGTLHFVAAQDVRWLLALLTPRRITQAARRHAQLALVETTFARSKEVFVKALQGGKQCTRDELYQALEQAGISTSGQRGYHLLVRSAQDGLICFGVPRAKEQTFALLDEWLPPTKTLAREEALAELTRRYFTSHGPATLQDLMRWAGITTADAKLGLAAAQPDLTKVTAAGHDYWLAHSQPPAANAGAASYLLPGFDEYLLGYADRSAMLDPTYAQRICPGGNGVFRPTVVIDGRVVGTWQRTLKRHRVGITLALFNPLTEAQHESLAKEAQRYGAFVGLPAVLE